MSQENVEIARQVVSAYKERGIGGVWVFYADDCSIGDIAELPDAGTYTGRSGLRERDRHFVEVWGEFDVDGAQFIDAGESTVVVVAAIRGRGEGSDVPFDGKVSFVWEFRSCKIVRDRSFMSRSAALKAVGLEE